MTSHCQLCAPSSSPAGSLVAGSLPGPTGELVATFHKLFHDKIRKSSKAVWLAAWIALTDPGQRSKFRTHGRLWLAMAGHGWPWLAMAGHGWPWLVIPGLVMAGHGWPSRPAMAMASHDRPWPNMAGRGWSFLVNGRSMVSQGPNEHSFSILMLDARKFHQKYRLKSENRRPPLAMPRHGRPWLAISPGNGLAMASNGRPWPGMVGHVRTMASQWSANDPALKHMATFGIAFLFLAPKDALCIRQQSQHLVPNPRS